MELTVLGRYGPYPAAGGACSGYLLTCAGRGVLIDCGNGVLSRLQTFMPIGDLSAIFLSHLHYDHISDLFILRYALQALRASGKIPPTPLKVFAPSEPESAFNVLSQLAAFEMIRIEKGLQVRQDGMDVRFEAMSHPFPSFAMAFTHSGKRFVYSGDTNMNNRLAPFAEDADLFLVEAGLLAKDKDKAKAVTVPHLTAREAGEIAAMANVKRMLCTHFSPACEPSHVEREAASVFPGAKGAVEMETYEI